MGEARELAEPYYERFGTGDLDSAAALFADDCATVTPRARSRRPSTRTSGRCSGTRCGALTWSSSGPSRRTTRSTSPAAFKGTHQGDLVSPQGTIPASGNPLDRPFADHFRVRGGKIVEHEVIWDQMTMLGQLGALPPA